MSDLQKNLDQVKLDAERITRKRFEANEQSKAWQESKDRPVTLDEQPAIEAAKPEVEESAPKKAVNKKGKK